MTINYVVKLKLARYYVAGLGLVEVPIGISRLKKGAWKISSARFPDLELHMFLDSNYTKGAVGALLAALDVVYGYMTKRLRALETEERAIKVTKLDTVGVSYYVYENKGANIHRFCVSTPGDAVKSVEVYIGTDSTVLSNWDFALETACDLRHTWECKRNIASHWRGLNAVRMERPV
jgi:hypothetical protein